MKKFISLMLIMLIVVSLSACGNAGGDTSGADSATDSATLKDIMVYVVESAGMDTEGDWDYFSKLTSPEDAASIVGAPTLDCSFTEGISYTGVLGAFDFAMFRTENNQKAVELAKLLEDNANLGKYICMFAETAKTAVRGNVVMFIMSNENTANNYIGYFNSFGK